MKLQDIHFRDPYVVLYKGRYYMCGSSGYTGQGFAVFTADDLYGEWTGPIKAFGSEQLPHKSEQFWAPEIHFYKDNFYMFATMQQENGLRGTYILRSTTGNPEGPYTLHSNGAITPNDWHSLDGTLYVSRDGQPYMVFCHEWVQIQQGTICAVALSDDLREPIGEPQLLIRAANAHWEHPRKDMMVTDGPFLHRSADGSLLMIWSSFTKDNRYVTVVCRSDNGEIDGKWSYLPGFLCQGDSGHGMLFTDKNGQLTLSLHSPNNSPDERPVFHAVREDQTKGLILL